MAAASPVRSLHHRTPTPRQGDRPRRRSSVAVADGDRLQPGRDRPAPAFRRPAQDGGLHLAKETDDASVERLARLRADLAEKSEELAGLNARWEAEKAGLNKVGDLRAHLDDLRTQADKLQREGDYEGASKIRYGDIPALEKELAAADLGEAAQSTDLMVKERVGADDIAEVISSWTGIPAGRLLQGRDREAPLDGIDHRLPPDRPGVGRPGGLGRGAPQPRRTRRPQPPDRLLPLPRSDRCRQDRVGEVARGLPLRRRASHGPHRHE